MQRSNGNPGVAGRALQIETDDEKAGERGVEQLAQAAKRPGHRGFAPASLRSHDIEAVVVVADHASGKGAHPGGVAVRDVQQVLIGRVAALVSLQSPEQGAGGVETGSRSQRFAWAILLECV
jgi:hypothetical protein